MRKKINLNKATWFSIVINSIQILLAGAIGLIVVLRGDQVLNGAVEQAVVGVMAAIVVWGAVVDIRDAHYARKVADESDMLEQAYGQLEAHNRTLRAQRHDFMNHLQVIFALIEMGEGNAAREYIEKLHGDIELVGRALKTAVPAVNALLAAKLNDLEEDGIHAQVAITSAWRDLPVPGWEMCRVLGNLIDNAADATRQVENREIGILLGEDEQGYRFAVENTGPDVPAELRERIFEAGFSTKGEGHGMGLAIVREILEQYGGRLELESKNGRTRFSGWIPRETREDNPSAG